LKALLPALLAVSAVAISVVSKVYLIGACSCVVILSATRSVSIEYQAARRRPLPAFKLWEFLFAGAAAKIAKTNRSFESSRRRFRAIITHCSDRQRSTSLSPSTPGTSYTTSHPILYPLRASFTPLRPQTSSNMPSATGRDWEKYQKKFADDEVPEKKITPLTDEDIQVLKTYGAAPYAADLRRLEKSIKEKQASVNEKTGTPVPSLPINISTDTLQASRYF
jgi:hypothetical protein